MSISRALTWSTRSAWIYQGSNIDVAKMAAHSIEGIYLDPRSDNAPAVISSLSRVGKWAGLYYDPSWYAWDDPVTSAQRASSFLTHLGLNAYWQPMMFDLETQDLPWVTTFLTIWRRLRPERMTAYTNGAFQAGYVPSALLLTLNVHVYITLYYGDMSPVDGAAAMMEIARQGTPPKMLHPFYDGKALPSDARDGCVFTLERLP